MRIRITFLLSYAILALCFGAIGYTGYILLHTTQDAFKEVVDKGIPILKALEDIRFASLRMMASTSEYGVLRADRSANNPAPEQEAEADRRKDNPNKLVVSAAQLYETAFQHYAQLIEAFFPQDRARLDLLQKADLNLKAKSAQIRILKQLGQADRELLEIQERFVDDVDAFLDIVGTLITHYTTQLEQQKLVIRMTAQSALWSLLGMSGFAILLACYTSFRLARAIAIPLEKLQQAVLPFGSGPLQPRVEISAPQEIRTLAAAFDQMADALNHMTIAKKDVDNVLHSMADSLMVLDPDGTIRSVNRATLDLLGYDAESLMGHAMCLFLGDSDAHCYDERRPAPLEFFTRKVETTYRAKNGALIPVSFSGSLVQDEAGCVEGIVCVAHDTSERNRFEQEFQQDTQELQEARQVAEAASRAKSEVVSDRESGQDRASTHLDAETLHHLEALDLPGQPSLYNWVIEHFLDTTPELMSTLRRAVQDDDASELQRIAHNLKSSAGNVGALSLAERYHNLEAMGRAHNLSGAEAELDKLETFFCAACDELTGLLQSTPAAPQRVSVLPEPGLVVPCTSRGTSRRGDAACLPPCQTKKVTPTALHPSLQAVTAIDDEQPTLNVRAQSAHVLIVDDDDTVRALARRVLEQQGFTVAAVADGAEAVAAFALTRPDMVLLDVDIPYIDGFAVLTMFRAMPDGARVPVVMMTGLDDAASINRAYEAGATDFITKPLNQFLLPHRVRYMLRASQTEAALRASEQRFRAIFKEAAMGIAQVDVQGRIIESNFALARILGYTTDELGAMTITEFTHPDDGEADQELYHKLMAGQRNAYSMENRYYRKDGHLVWARLTVSVVRTDEGAATFAIGMFEDITARKQAESERQRLQQQLIDSSRQAGMAELATSVLHNVGNVLNSINVSATLLTEQLQKSSVVSLVKASDLIQDHAAELGRFITQDEHGKHFPQFLSQLANKLYADQESWIAELDTMMRNINHIKIIVSLQQSYARTSGVQEEVLLETLVEDALRAIDASLLHHGIELVREFEPLPSLLTDKHKVLQILVNLLSNAVQALGESTLVELRLIVRIFQPTSHRVAVEVCDTGVGIAKAHLPRIFEYGFTTKPDGHGFGLHSCGLMARQLGGEITVRSEGLGCGATLRLELPF